MFIDKKNVRAVKIPALFRIACVESVSPALGQLSRSNGRGQESIVLADRHRTAHAERK
jgi:hypothetical protein